IVLLPERASTAILLGESHFREFKSGLHGAPGNKSKRDIKDISADIAQTLVAFANADGGELLVGVDDNGTVTGLDDFDEAAVADQISKGMSAEKCLQYLDLAEYAEGSLRLRRAALLLFARGAQRWHPRLQIRVIKVNGTEVLTGAEYNVITDEPVSGNIIHL